MADGARSTQFGGHVPRRLSYASVASGATPQNVPHAPRSGYLSHLSSTTPSNSYPPVYPQEQRNQRRQSTHDQDLSTGAGISWRKPASLPSYSRKFNGLPGMGVGVHSSNSFFVPSYLRNSTYVAKLDAENRKKMARERQQPSGPASNAPSLSSSANTGNIHRIAPSHRGMTYDVIESNPPKDEDQLMPLPSRWSDQDKYPGLDISNGGLDVRYSGAASKADIEAASVRADYPMSPACGIYYFEVTVNCKNKDCAIAVGFSTAEASLERLPGWETHSWGYHGDDGKMFSGEHAGRHYGPTFSANDVVGCGICFHTGCAFFTLNGKDLDVCFRDLKDIRPFPTVGMKKYSGASVSVNFGQRPFIFDIDSKMASMEEKVHAEIRAFRADHLVPGLNEDQLIQKLVLQYLTHDGYVETAAALAEEINKENMVLNTAQPGATIEIPKLDTTEAVHRQKIRRAILEGNIDAAVDITNDHFPNVLANNPKINFHLKCRKWVELIAQAAELRTLEQSTKARRTSNGFAYCRGSSSAVADDFAQDMELDDTPISDGRQKSGTGGDAQYNDLLGQAMDFGQVLQREYRDDQDAEIQTALTKIFSLVAYDNPKESTNGELLDKKGRADVAEELNSAILVSLGRSPDAALIILWKETQAMLSILSERGGPASFVNLRKLLKLDKEVKPETKEMRLFNMSGVHY